jgi:hypothetical protein
MTVVGSGWDYFWVGHYPGIILHGLESTTKNLRVSGSRQGLELRISVSTC